MSRLLVLAFALTLASARARAEPDDQAPAQSYSFDDERVVGDLVSPLGETLHVRKRGSRASLIEVRTSYLDKLLQSVEDF